MFYCEAARAIHTHNIEKDETIKKITFHID